MPAVASSPLIAFHLPQFHPIPENNEWWGHGFTEWTNVTRAKPRFFGHYQPHLPSDLGYYDLRLPEARQAQADLARQYGIEGFCYYHYWFNSRRLLERPVNEILKSGQPDFPFCLCWANETWSRNWDGGSRQVLVDQSYSSEDDLAHIRWLLPALSDSRYIRVEGKPLFLVYRVSDLPDPRRTTDLWRAEAIRAGIGDLFLARVESNFAGERGDPTLLGFDAAVEFAPDTTICRDVRKMSIERKYNLVIKKRLSYRLGSMTDWYVNKVENVKSAVSTHSKAIRDNMVVRYSDLVSGMLAKPTVTYKRFPCVCPGWDNTARRKTNAMIIVDESPTAYEAWLREVIRRERTAGRENFPIFVNAWNEWAEGCHLEPDQKWGRRYLEATARAVGGSKLNEIEAAS